jgi:hypothetical protein
MKRAKTAKMIVLLACCLLLTACPPSGGYLVPQGQAGAEVKTIVYSRDTLVVERNQLSVAARGVWSVADSDTSVILIVNNRNADSVVIDFDKCEMVNNESQDKLSLRSVSEETAKNGPAFLSERTVIINGGQERQFNLEFKINSADGRSGVARNVLGETATLRIPVVLKGETTSQVDFIITFKYGDYRSQS